MKVTVHCLVKNEENFVWFAINSVIDYVDEIMVWDMGSTDKTSSIVKSINSKKISFKKVDCDVSAARQLMLDATKSDWILILDGDEIWWDGEIEKLVQTMQSTSAEVLVVSNYMCIGDVFHHQEELAGRYKIWGKTGTVTVRAFRKNIPGLKVSGVYPFESYVNGQGLRLQELPRQNIFFSDAKYLHTSFLRRTSVENKKIKYEFGLQFPSDYFFPEVFFKQYPTIIPSPWRLPDLRYKLLAVVQTPLKKIKRRILMKGDRGEN